MPSSSRGSAWLKKHWGQAGSLNRCFLQSCYLGVAGRIIEAFARTGCDMIEVSAPLMQSLADIESTQGLMAVFPVRRLPVPEHLDFVLIAEFPA